MKGAAISEDVLAPRLPVVGRIQIGGKVAGQKHPEKYDHFKLRKLTRGGDGNFELDHELHEILGPKPTTLDVRLPFDTKAENLYAQMVHYPGRTCARKCDGEKYVDPRTGVGGTCEQLLGKECPCKPYARIGVVLEAAPTFGGLHVYRTTSWASVAAMATVLRTLEQELETLRGLPMQMQLHPGEVKYRDSDGNEKTGTAYRVALVLRATFDEAREAMLEYHRQNRIARREVKMIAGATLEELDELDRREELDIVAEFHPKALTDGSERRSKLAEINAPVEQPEDETPVEGLVLRMRELMESLPGTGLTLTETQLESLEGAIDSGNESHLRTGIDWIETRIAKRATTTTDQEG